MIYNKGSVLATMNREELIKSYLRGPAFTGWNNGEVIAIAGVTIMWPGTGEAWVLFSEDYRKHTMFIHRESLRHLGWIAEKFKLKRIQACALKESESANRWLEHLGFNAEGDMPNYFGDKTFTRYARIFQ